MIELKLFDVNRDCRLTLKAQEIDTVYEGEYREGDTWQVQVPENSLVAMQLDECLAESVLYLADGSFRFEIPFGYPRAAGYGKSAFEGTCHRVRVRVLEEEAYAYRNVALNAHDRHGASKGFPHATANFVTREDPCFFERNAIDGHTENVGHGSFPFHSWAGGAREDLEFSIDFGRPIKTDRIVFYLRADFPHDTYWKSIDVRFSDGSVERAHFEKTEQGQALTFPEKVTSTALLGSAVPD